MHYYTQVKQIRETEQGTDLIIHIPNEKLHYRISKYGQGNKVDAEIRINDSRSIRADQRKKIFATIRDIATYTGDDPEYIRGILLYDFCIASDVMPFSLSDCSVAIAREYLDYIIEFALAWHIPLRDKGVDRTDDIDKYLYFCIKHRVCAITGQSGADIHHVDAIGMGANRDKVDHTQYRLIALSRHWHRLVHDKGEDEIFKKNKVYGIKVDEETLDYLGIKSKDIT